MGTFFAAFVAAYLFNDWKDQAIYDTKKQHLSSVIATTNKMRYELLSKQEIIENILKVNNFAVINDNYRSLNNINDSSVNEAIFSIRASFIFLKDDFSSQIPNLLEYYGKIHHHYIHICNPYSIFIHNYEEYYDYIKNEINPDKLNFNHNMVNRAYNYYGLTVPFREQAILLQWRNRPIGYDQFDETKQKNEEIRYSNILEMIKETIKMIDKVENLSIKLLKPNVK